MEISPIYYMAMAMERDIIWLLDHESLERFMNWGSRWGIQYDWGIGS